jgi:hypothetical protein
MRLLNIDDTHLLFRFASPKITLFSMNKKMIFAFAAKALSMKPLGDYSVTSFKMVPA